MLNHARWYVMFGMLIFGSTGYAACDDALPTLGVRDDVLIVVNDNSLDSCEVGRYYAQQRGFGKNNIAHIVTPALYWLEWSEFRNMMDQLIVRMQQPELLKAGAPPAPVCTAGITPYYCQASIDHLRQYTKIRYLVLTRGVPTRSPIGGSALWFPTETTSIDNYLAYWLIRYFPDNNADGFSDDVVLNFTEREKAFKDGRGMRVVAPGTDGELIVGRIDGVSLDATKALIDRIIDVENNGMYGKHYGSKFGTYTGYARWFDYSANNLVYGTSFAATGDAWRYQLGIFGESRQECIDYMNFSSSSTAGKAPQSCQVKFADSTPGVASSRTPIADDALVYFGNLQGQSSGKGDFNTILNWVKDTSCTVKLCSDAADPDACRAQSTDALKELNTQCVGVGDGFIGYNYQSYPVSYMTLWPTNWQGPGGGSSNNLAFPDVRSDIGFDDNYSVWFRNTDSVAAPYCYSGSTATGVPTVPCRDKRSISLYQYVNFPAQAVNTASPQQYTVSLRYMTENILSGTTLRVQLRAYEPTTGSWVDYGSPVLATVASGSVGWTYVQTTFTMDPAKHTSADLLFNQLEVRVNTGLYTGSLALDTVSFKQEGVGSELLQNTSFDGGHKSVSGGDHAAMYLSRLNGVGFWGSASHHQSGGHSFSTHSQETLLYFMRGLPLGDAVWWGEGYNSGLFYGDPIYSPIAVRFEYVNDWDYVAGMVSLRGSAVNGRDPSLVSTGYTVEYCPGSDFYVCDRAGSWIATGISGVGGHENMDFGVWDVTSLAVGDYTLRLAVTSTNPSRSRMQTYYDYYPVTVYDPVLDNDGDGLSNGDEVGLHGTNPNSSDTDSDGLSDYAEVIQYQTNPLIGDTDGDGMPDKWEADNGTNPRVADAEVDLDNDGLSNLEELTNGCNPLVADTDGDGVNDGPEVKTHGTKPNLPDSDGDGLTDGEEINIYISNPLSAIDTDKDGMADDWERARGTDPLLDDALVDADNDGVVNIVERFKLTLPLDSGSVPVLNEIHVDGSNSSGVEDGSVAYPFDTVAEALAVAVNGDTIRLATGTYNLGYQVLSKSIRIVGPADRSATLSGELLYAYNMKWGGIEDAIVRIYSNYLGSMRNVVFKNVEYFPGEDIYPYNGSKLVFSNCLFRNPGTATEAFWIESDSTVALVNTTIVGFPRGIYVADATSSATVRNSILSNVVDFEIVGNGVVVSYSQISDGQFVGSNGNIAGSPLFVDAAAGDYRLLANSPTIDAGDPGDGYGNEPAPNGCRINMGSYGNTSTATVSSHDPDGDGLFAYCEDRAGTNPNHPDSDRDSLSDGQEVLVDGTDPLNIFSPRGEGMNLSPDVDFTLSTEVFTASQTLQVLTWSNLLNSANIKSATYTLHNATGGVLASGELTNHSNGTYSAAIALGPLNYSGGASFTVSIQENGKRPPKYAQTRSLTITGGTPPPVDDVPPSVPTGISATAGKGRITVTWNAATDNVGVVGYTVSRTMGGVEALIALDAAATRFVDSPLVKGDAVTYKVRARDAAGNVSAYTNTVSAVAR